MATKKHLVKPAESANAIPKYDASFFVATPVPAYGISTALERETYSISGSQTTPTECQQRFFIPISPLVTGRFWDGAGGSPNQRPWGLSHDGFMSGWFQAWSSFPSRKSLVGGGFITKAAVSGGLALWVYGAPFCFGFPDDLGLRGSSLLGTLVGAGGGAGLN